MAFDLTLLILNQRTINVGGNGKEKAISHMESKRKVFFARLGEISFIFPAKHNRGLYGKSIDEKGKSGYNGERIYIVQLWR